MNILQVVQLCSTLVMIATIVANLWFMRRNRLLGLALEQNLSATRSKLAAAQTLESAAYELKKRVEYRLIIATDGLRHALFLAEGGETDIVIASLNKTLKLMGEGDGCFKVRQNNGPAGQETTDVPG